MESKDLLLYASLLLNERALHEAVKHMLVIGYIRFSIIIYTYNAMIQLDSRMRDLGLLLKDHTITIIWEKNSEGEKRGVWNGESCAYGTVT